MIPKNSVDVCPIAQVLFTSLKKQLGSLDRVVQYIFIEKKFSGSLFWIQHQRQSLFLYLANSTEREINLDNIKVNPNKEEITDFLKNKEISQLREFQKDLLPKALMSHKEKLAPFIVIDPYASDAKKHVITKSLGLYFFGKEFIKSKVLGSLIYKLLGIASSDLVYQHMRGIFNPEISINKNSDEKLSVVKGMLLDEDQEIAAKTDIILNRDQYRSDNYNLTGVNGGVASGKTETLIHRVKLIKQFRPDSNVVIITANSASKILLRERYNQINSDKSVEIYSFNEWVKRELKPSEHLVDQIELTKIIKSQLKINLKAHDIDRSIFLRELDFIYGRNIYYENDYLLSQTVSRAYHLSEEQFKAIWKSVLTLKNELSAKNWLLAVRIPQLLFDKLMEKPINSFIDHILVDDAHLLAPIAFELFKKVLKPESGQLFITQNPNQGVINPCQLWKETHLDLRGQSTRLPNIYKKNLSIINASRAFYLNRLPNENNQEILSSKKSTAEASLPQLLHFHAEKDEENRLLNEVKKLIHEGHDLREILIITSHKKTTYIADFIGKTLGVSVDILNESFYYSHKKRRGLGICDFMQAQGQSATYVYIFGLQQLFEREKMIEPGTNQCQVKLVENTRLISMAMTRAKKELTLFITADEVPKAFITPYISIPTDSNTKDEKESVISYLQNSG